jgi:hypothetical protein
VFVVDYVAGIPSVNRQSVLNGNVCNTYCFVVFEVIIVCVDFTDNNDSDRKRYNAFNDFYVKVNCKLKMFYLLKLVIVKIGSN